MSGKPNCCYFHLDQANRYPRGKRVLFPSLNLQKNNNNNKIKAYVDKGHRTRSFALTKFAFIKTEYAAQLRDDFGVLHSPA